MSGVESLPENLATVGAGGSLVMVTAAGMSSRAAGQAPLISGGYCPL